MIEANHKLLRDWADELTPTVDANYNLVEQMPRVPICVACPMAQWYKRESTPPKPDMEQKPPTLECFCTAFRGVMYNGGQAVTECDAFRDARDRSVPDASTD